MRKKIPVVALLLLLAACSTPKAAETPGPTVTSTDVAIATPMVTPAPKPETPGYVDHTVKVGEDEFIVRMVGEGVDGEGRPLLGSIEVYQEGEHSTPIQTLDFGRDQRADASVLLDSEFREEDMNFDGWNDFRIYGGHGTIGDIYFFWVWRPEEEKFALLNHLMIASPVFDRGTRLVYSTMNYGIMWGNSRTACRWKGDELEPLLSFDITVNAEQNYSQNSSYSFAQDGDLKTVKSWTGSGDEWGDKRIPPEAEPYSNLASPPWVISDPAYGEYSVWRLVDMGEGRPLYAARLTSEYLEEDGYNSLKELAIYAADDLSAPLQVISLERGRQFNPPGTDFGFTVEDINFDGWPDLNMESWLGAYSAGRYYLLYDPATGRFERNKSAEKLLTYAEMDKEHRTIRNWWHSGDTNYTELYRWIDGQPVMVRLVKAVPPTTEGSRETEWDYIVSDYVDGTLVEVKHYVNPRQAGDEAALAEVHSWETDPDYHGEI